MKFHLYLRELRQRRFKDTRKLCLMLGVSKDMWRKLERGINPPPRRSILRKFCILVNALSYEENQLYTLARRWEPHPDTNTTRHNLYHKGLDPSWMEAIVKENTPDYPHRYWRS